MPDFDTAQVKPINPSLANLPSELHQILTPPPREKFVRTILFINLFLLFGRPENDIEPLGKIYFVFLMSLIPLPFWLPRIRDGWTRSTKAMLLLLVFGGIMGPFARNTFWAFHTWRDLLQTFCLFLFPMTVFFRYGQSLRRLGSLVTFIGVYLGIYAMSHSGRGPGGIVGDENDICLALVMCLPFPLFFVQASRTVAGKLSYIASAFAVLGGVVATVSRGGFLGVIGIAGYLLWRSEQKFVILFISLLFVIAGGLFVPSQYWHEMESIQKTDEGTAKERFETWKRAIRIFFDRRFMIQGVGMSNTKYHIADYEEIADMSELDRSFAGREVHSLYVQLLADLGLIGLVIFLSAVGAALMRNGRSIAEFYRELDRLPQLQRLLHGRIKQTNTLSCSENNEQERNVSLSPEHTLNTLNSELRYGVALFSALNGSLLGMLISSAFLSVLYYPMIWFIVVFSATAGIYKNRLLWILNINRLISKEPSEEMSL